MNAIDKRTYLTDNLGDLDRGALNLLGSSTASTPWTDDYFLTKYRERARDLIPKAPTSAMAVTAAKYNLAAMFGWEGWNMEGFMNNWFLMNSFISSDAGTIYVRGDTEPMGTEIPNGTQFSVTTYAFKTEDDERGTPATVEYEGQDQISHSVQTATEDYEQIISDLDSVLSEERKRGLVRVVFVLDTLLRLYQKDAVTVCKHIGTRSRGAFLSIYKVEYPNHFTPPPRQLHQKVHSQNKRNLPWEEQNLSEHVGSQGSS